MAHVTPGEEAALNEFMQMLEAQPVESTSTYISSLISLISPRLEVGFLNNPPPPPLLGHEIS